LLNSWGLPHSCSQVGYLTRCGTEHGKCQLGTVPYRASKIITPKDLERFSQETLAAKGQLKCSNPDMD